MATTSPKALPYPVPTDPVAQGADAIRKLAQSVDFMVQSGNASLDLPADTNTSVTVTFPRAFAANPVVVSALNFGPPTAAGSSHSLWTTAISTTGVTLGVRRNVAITGAQVRWIAVGPVTAVT